MKRVKCCTDKSVITDHPPNKDGYYRVRCHGINETHLYDCERVIFTRRSGWVLPDSIIGWYEDSWEQLDNEHWEYNTFPYGARVQTYVID